MPKFVATQPSAQPKRIKFDKEVNEAFTAIQPTPEESYEMNAIKSNNNVYQGIPIERLLVDTHRLLAKIESSKNSPSLFDFPFSLADVALAVVALAEVV